MITHDALRTTILRRMDECDELANLDEPDPELVCRRGAQIVEEVGDRMARIGFPDLYRESREYSPFADPLEAKVFLSQCLKEIPEPAAVESPYLDCQRAADYLGISRKQLYRQVELGKLKPLRGPRNSYLFTKAILDNYAHGK